MTKKRCFLENDAVKEISEEKSELPKHLQDQFDYVHCDLNGTHFVSSQNSAGSFFSLGVNNSFDFEKFEQNLDIKILESSSERVIFDISNIDVSIINALRRILLSEVPSIAPDTVYIYQNTGVIQDEVLAHRLGLVPFDIDPDLIEWRKENEELTAKNCVKFKLHVKCTRALLKENSSSYSVYSRDLEWIPMDSNQQELFASNPPRPAYSEILITKMRPGQEIELEIFCEKGIGKTHAKWSPVCTAVYRLLPRLTFLRGTLKNEEAEELKTLCPMDVFDIENGETVIRDARRCTTCRACLERFPKDIKLEKHKRFFIFSIESTGTISAEELFIRAIQCLKNKLITAQNHLDIFLLEQHKEL